MTSRAIPAEHCRTRWKKEDSNCNLRNSCVIVLLSYRWLFFPVVFISCMVEAGYYGQGEDSNFKPSNRTCTILNQFYFKRASRAMLH